MSDMVAYIHNRNEGSQDGPLVMIVLQNGRLQFFAPPGSPFSSKARSLNIRSADLDEEEAADYFDTYVDRWNGQNLHASVAPLQGAEARKAEATKAKWRKS